MFKKVIGWLFMALFIGVLVGGHLLEPWQHMWAIAVAMFLVLKWFSFALYPQPIAHFKTYLFLWPGLNPSPFANPSDRTVNHPQENQWIFTGALNIMFGLSCFLGAKYLNNYELIAGWILCAGIVFVLHFGALRLLAGLFRKMGFAVEPIMDNPLAAKSVSELWGRRWNKAFHHFVHPIIFVPIKNKWGAKPASLAVFVFSGFVHELAISVPAQAGYGLPALYFLIQALGIFIERKLNLQSRVYTYLFVAGPAFILFHPDFIKNVILPFGQALGVYP